ncbi:MAG: GTPase Era [Proteobacteria bacterium]|nr:GTPase Era [Pseudomonadota bacterium]MCH8322101.1 GTPase Era [Pseudomonadota bacterium]
MNTPVTRAGFVALVGAPNAGKSTLLNALVGAKIAIVTHKVQTTRNRILGITIRGPSQIIFIDTPGIFKKPKRRLERAMVDAAWKGISGADLTALMVDAKAGITGQARYIAGALKKQNVRAVLVLNKIDKVARDQLLAQSGQLNKMAEFEETFMISALKGDGVSDLFDYLSKAVPKGPWLYPEDQMTDVSLRFLASEITREQIFLNLHQELPYALAVETTRWQERRDGSVRIEQNILCDKDGHKAMVIGKKGAMLKKIGTAAREEMGQVFDRKVHLFLFVKVSKDWLEKPFHYREIGLDFPG